LRLLGLFNSLGLFIECFFCTARGLFSLCKRAFLADRVGCLRQRLFCELLGAL
jgi:hypothetical protein